MRFIIFSLCLLFFVVACNEEVATPSADNAAEVYFPLQLNQPKFYAVDSIVLYNTVGGIVYDTTSLEARETLVESFTGADGQLSFRGERWERNSPADPWVFRQTYTQTVTATAARRSEDNLTFTKLVFPLRTGKSWDGNAAFDTNRDFTVGGEFLDVYNGWNYTYTAIDQSVTLPGGATFDGVVYVEQAEILDNLIDLRVAYERYAPGVGLIERFIDARHTQCRSCCNGDTPSCLDLSWDEKAEKGYIIQQVLRP